jgi:hypothetical protein
MSKDGTYIFVETETGDGIYVFSRTGDVWSYESTIPISTQERIEFQPASFNTTTGVDATNDYITTDAEHVFVWETIVRYNKDGGTANTGLIEHDQAYWVRPPFIAFANTSVNTTSDYITSAGHPFATGEPVRMVPTGTDPDQITNLVPYTVYYVRSLASNQIAFYPTATDAINDTSRIDLAYTGTWSSSAWSIQSANRVRLYLTQLDAQNQTNRVELTSGSAETHILYIGNEYYTGYTNGFQPRVHTNATGSRVCTANVKEGCPATVTVWDRSGTVWTETAKIPVRNSNAIDWDNAGASYWQIDYKGTRVTLVEDALTMSGDGNTIMVGSSAEEQVYADYLGITGFTFVASNPLYSNKPTIEISGSMTFEGIRPGAKFSIETYPTPSPVDGRYVVSDVETNTIISVDAGLSTGTIVDYTSADPYLVFDSMFVHIYRYNGSTWNQAVEFVPPTTIPSDDLEFGRCGSAINYDGTVVAVGDTDYPASASEQGRVYIFEEISSNWSHTDTLIGDPDVYQRLGSDIEFTPDGNKIVVGAPWYTIEPSNTGVLPYAYPETYLTQLLPVPPYRYSAVVEGTYDYLDTYAVGKTYLFERTGVGSPFAIERSIYPVDNNGYGMYFGNGVSITDNGKTVAIAAPETKLTNYEGPVVEPQDWQASEVGSVRVWEELSVIEDTEPRYQAYYLESEWPLIYAGYSKFHTLSSDGTTLAVGYDDRADIDIYTTADNGITWSLPYTIKIEGAIVAYSCCLNENGTKIAILMDIESFQSVRPVTFEKVGNDWIRRPDILPRQLLPDTAGAPYYQADYYGVFGQTSWDYNLNALPNGGLQMSADGSTLFVTHYRYGVNVVPSINFTSGTDVDSANDHIVFTYPHPFETGEYVRYLRWGSPGANIGLTDGNYYYARVVDKYRISLHSSYSNAINNVSKINLTATGTQMQSIHSPDYRAEVLVYTWNSGTNSWDEQNTHAMQVRTATGSSLPNAESMDFGHHMSTSADGNTLVVTTSFQRMEYNATNSRTGDKRVWVYIYERVAAPPTFTPEWVTVVSGGTGYSVNDILTVVGGTPTSTAMEIRVTGVSSGVITSAIVETASTYEDVYELLEEVSVTGGTGANARLQVWWDGARYRINTASIASGGSNYQRFDIVSLADGTPEGTVDPATNSTFYMVDTLSGTAAATISLQSNQIYTSIPNPSTPAATVGDNGTGLTLNLTWKLATQQYENGYLWKLIQKTHEFWSAEPIQNTQYVDSTPIDSTYGKTPVAMSADASVIAVAHNSYQHVYVLEKGPHTQDATFWTTSFWSPTPLERTGFGVYNSVSVSADGSTIAIGASHTEDTSLENVGKVYVYKKINSNWKLVSTISCPCTSYGEQFGYSTSLNSDGSILTVGSTQYTKASFDTTDWSRSPAGRVDIYLTTNPGYEIGCALDFQSDETNVEALTVNPSVSKPYMRIGDSVDIVSDGQRAIVGGAETTVYSNLFIDGVWILEQELIPSAMSINDRIRNEYGCAVKLNESNHTLAFVSAPKTTVSGNVNAGVVYVYERSGTTWTLRDTISAAVPAANAFFGADIGINHLGTVLAVSTRASGSGSAGEAYVFRYISSAWTETKITPPHTLIDSGAVACIEAPFSSPASVAFGGRDAAGQARVYIYSVDLTTGVATLGHTYVGGVKDPTPIPFDITNIAVDPNILYTGPTSISVITTDVPHGFTNGEPVQYSKESGTENLLFLNEVRTFFQSRYWVEPLSSTELRITEERGNVYDPLWYSGAILFPAGSASGSEVHYLIPLKKYSAGCEKGSLSFGWIGDDKLFLAIGDPTAADTYGHGTLGQVDVLSSTNAVDFAAGPWTHVQTILPPHIGYTKNLSESESSPDIRFGSNVYFRGYDLAISSTNYTDVKTRFYNGFRTSFSGGAWIYQKLFEDRWIKTIDLIPTDQNMQYFKSVAISANQSYAVLGGSYFYHPSEEEGELPIVTFDTNATGNVSSVTLVSGGTNQWYHPGMYFDREGWNRRVAISATSDPGFSGLDNAMLEYDVDIITGTISNLSISRAGNGYTPNLVSQPMPTTFGSYEAGEWMTHVDKPQVGQAKILNRLVKSDVASPPYALIDTFVTPTPGFNWGSVAHMSADGNVIAVAGYSPDVHIYRRDELLNTWSLEESLDLTPYLNIRLANLDPNLIHLSDDGTRLVVSTERDFFTFDYIGSTWTYVDMGCPIPGTYIDSRHLSGDGTRYIVGLDYSGIIVYKWHSTLYSTMGDSVNGGYEDTAYFDGVGDNGSFTIGSGYSVDDIITLTDGSQIRVIDVDTGGEVLYFKFVRTSNTTLGTGPFTTGSTLTQQTVDPVGGTGFSITTGINNETHWYEEDIIGKAIITQVTIDNPGSGYTLGDQLTISGLLGNYLSSGIYNEQAVVEVTSIGGSGDITGLTIVNPGDYPNYPIDIYYLQSNPRNLVGGTGSGATVSLYGRNLIEESDYQGYANEFPYRVHSSSDGSVVAGTAGRWTIAADPEYGQSPTAITYTRTGAEYNFQQISVAYWNPAFSTTGAEHNIAMSPDGTFMCITNSYESSVYVFQFDGTRWNGKGIASYARDWEPDYGTGEAAVGGYYALDMTSDARIIAAMWEGYDKIIIWEFLDGAYAVKQLIPAPTPVYDDFGYKLRLSSTGRWLMVTTPSLETMYIYEVPGA